MTSRTRGVAGDVISRTLRAVAVYASVARVRVRRRNASSRSIDDVLNDRMMRPLRVPIAVATAAMLLLAAGEACARADSADVEPRASEPSPDLELAADSGSAHRPSKLDAAQAGRATNAALPSVPSVEEYVEPSCASPATEDQQRCLSAYLATSNLVLDRYYQALILRLESEAGVPSGAEPPAVQRLRATQQAWVAYRDEACRRRLRGREGVLWAPARARCLIDYSMQRANELAGVLAERRALVPLAQPTPSRPSRTHESSRRSRPRRR